MSKYTLAIGIVLLSFISSYGCHHHTVRSYDYTPVDFEKWSSGLYNDELVGQAVIVEGYINKTPVTGGLTPRQGAFGMFRSPRIRVHVTQHSTDEISQAIMRDSHNANQISTKMIRIVSISAPLTMRDQIYALNNQQKVKVYGVARQFETGSIHLSPWHRIARKHMTGIMPLFVEVDRIEISK